MAAQDLPLAQKPEGAYLAAWREDYFAALAEAFPTLCLHDEFIFFPRLSAAWVHWFNIARLQAPVIEATAVWVAEILARLEEAAVQAESLEAVSEATLLRQSLKSVLRELGPGGPWEEDPFLYLKVAALAWAPVLARAPHLDWQNEEKLAHLLAQTAQLFAWGREQVRALTLPGQLLSSGAFADAGFFFHRVVPDFLEAHLPPPGGLEAPPGSGFTKPPGLPGACGVPPREDAFCPGGSRAHPHSGGKLGLVREPGSSRGHPDRRAGRMRGRPLPAVRPHQPGPPLAGDPGDL